MNKAKVKEFLYPDFRKLFVFVLISQVFFLYSFYPVFNHYHFEENSQFSFISDPVWWVISMFSIFPSTIDSAVDVAFVLLYWYLLSSVIVFVINKLKK